MYGRLGFLLYSYYICTIDTILTIVGDLAIIPCETVAPFWAFY